MSEVTVPTATHWGAYRAVVRDGRLAEIRPFEFDPDPSPIGQSLVGTLDDPCRILRPAVRAGWLRNGPRSPVDGRGGEPFVEVPWDEALDLVARELDRVRREHGNEAIYAGSYGWASAGRFHHAQSQIHRFMNCIGGYTASRNAYSYAAAEVIVPRVLGSFFGLLADSTDWSVIAEHSKLVVMFGGMPLRNAQVNPGGVGRHGTAGWLRAARANGCEFVNVTPWAADAADFLDARWLAPVPNTDTALMLGLAHVLLTEGLHDSTFIARCCAGWERFESYLTGTTDGVPKTPEWAADICGIDATTIRALARRMAATRTLITVSWSLQRSDHGEQPYWMAITLAAMLGQLGLPGGGFGCGYASVQGVGNPDRQLRWGALPRGSNPVARFIPVARIADMLLHPGGQFDYDGEHHVYPHVRIVYWAGGNPFHHHQDLNRLLTAWRQPETVIVHECRWNALARHADVVLPATTPLERDDIACDSRNGIAVAMHKAVEPAGEARDDHAIFADIARRLGAEQAFTEGRGIDEWLRWLWNVSRQRAAEQGLELPDYDAFRTAGHVELPPPERGQVYLEQFRGDPDTHPLATPSGRIEIGSATIAGFDYDDCPGHPAWLEPVEWLGAAASARYPLHLISCQPATRLHSQLDNGQVSRDGKVAGREPVTLNVADAEARGIRDGDVVRVFNDRGACLAGAVVTDRLRPGVAMLPTGAWYDPLEPGRPGSLEKHGNPNVLTADRGTSRLGQGPSAHSALVQVERFQGEPPPVTAFDPPRFVTREDAGAT